MTVYNQIGHFLNNKMYNIHYFKKDLEALMKKKIVFNR